MRSLPLTVFYVVNLKKLVTFICFAIFFFLNSYLVFCFSALAEGRREWLTDSRGRASTRKCKSRLDKVKKSEKIKVKFFLGNETSLEGRRQVAERELPRHFQSRQGGSNCLWGMKSAITKLQIDSGNSQQQGGNHAMGQTGPRAATKEEMAARAALMISSILQSFDLSGVNFPEILDNFLFFNYFKTDFSLKYSR